MITTVHGTYHGSCTIENMWGLKTKYNIQKRIPNSKISHSKSTLSCSIPDHSSYFSHDCPLISWCRIQIKVHINGTYMVKVICFLALIAWQLIVCVWCVNNEIVWIKKRPVVDFIVFKLVVKKRSYIKGSTKHSKVYLYLDNLKLVVGF